jgi:hypothetical protein
MTQRPGPPISELSLSRAWAQGDIPARLLTHEGDSLEIVYRGSWTHGFGPDFASAMIAWPDGRLETGSIEIHLTTAGWRDHGHHRDPAYNDVILHIVGIDDGAETRRADGRLVPVAVVGLEQAQAAQANLDWSRVGGDVCAADLAAKQPTLIVHALHHLGDLRLAASSTRFEAELALLPPAQVLWSALLEALGYAENREPMRQLAAMLPIADLERALAPSTGHFIAAAAHLLGTAGFLPLAPRDAETARLTPDHVAMMEAAWSGLARPASERMTPAAWHTARVRPANHPVARLLVAASLAAEYPSGLSVALLDLIRTGTFEINHLLTAVHRHGGSLGQDRATVIASSVLIPFALALSEQIGDPELAEGAMAAWDALPASAHNRLTRAGLLQVTGGKSLRGLGERGMHGLIHLHRTLCAPRRCYECPIAGLVVSEQEA